MGGFIAINAQTIIFEESFESTSAGNLPPNWLEVDRDGLGSIWGSDGAVSIIGPMGFSGRYCVNWEFEPDDLLITPVVNLPLGSLELTYKIGTYTYGVLDFDNHFAVYVLPETSTFTGNEIPIFEQTISVGDIALNQTVDLTSYAGQNIKIYFRHYNSDTKGFLIFDDVKITQSTLKVLEVKNDTKIKLYPNPVIDYLYLKTNSKINNVEIYDFVGRSVNIQQYNNKIDVRALQPGNYIIKIETKDGISLDKFIKK
jgi:hypothetical protein